MNPNNDSLERSPVAFVETQEVLFEFEGKTPDSARHSISGTFAESEDTSNPLPDLALDQIVILRVVGTVTKVNHVRMKDGSLERQHVIVLDSAMVLER